MTRPNQRIVQVGLTLLDHYALAAATAFEYLARERSVSDGWAPRGEPARRGSGVSSSTEGAVVSAEHFDEQAAEGRRVIADLEAASKAVGKWIADVGVPKAAEVKRCRDGQVGRDAHMWSANLQCPDLPTKSGLCPRHYMAYYRYRVAHRLAVDQDFEPGVVAS
jgi:hypothetical protein